MYSVPCEYVYSIINSDEHKIFYDCSTNSMEVSKILDDGSPSSNPFIEPNTIPKSKLKQAGNHLVKFRKDYYTGFMVSMLGNVATLYGASENKGDIILYGGVASLLGGILMLISFDSAGEAGEDLIDAGEKLETEQESN